MRQNWLYAGNYSNAIVDTTTVNVSNTLNLNDISNFAKWEISAVNATTQAETLAMVTASDYLFTAQRQFKRYTGQIKIRNSSSDTVYIGFPGTSFTKLVNGTLN